MSEENILNSIWMKLSNSEFLARTKSKGRKGIAIVFYPPEIMDIRDGNIVLPPGMFLRLTKESVKYYFDPKIFDSSINLNRKSKNEKSIKKIKNEIDKAIKLKLDDNWQILRLLDPRILLKPGNYEILDEKQLKNSLNIKIQYQIDHILRNYFLKLENEFIDEIPKKDPYLRLATISIDEEHNLNKIKQEEIFSKDQLTVTYDTSFYKIKQEIFPILEL